MLRPALLLLPLMLAPGCTQFPELDASISSGARAADWPSLVDINPLLSDAAQGRATPDLTASVEARAAALKARAARLQRRAVIDATTRSRMRAALVRHAALARP